MTIPVPIERLAETIARFGPAVLVVPSPQGWPRIYTVDSHVAATELVIPAPMSSALDYVAQHPLVSVVWTPVVHHGFTLIVDGWARVEGDDLRVRIDHGVLHRPAAHDDGPEWVDEVS